MKKEYTESDMIQFGVHIQKKKNYQHDLDIEWELTEYLGGKIIEKFNLDFVSNTEGVVCPRCGCNRVGLIDDKGYCLSIICQYKWAN